MSRLMDDQQKLATRFVKLYENFKKEGAGRRTVQRKEQYDADRLEIWTKLFENHLELMAADPPAGYEGKFNEVIQINEKFCTKLTTWVIDAGKPESSITTNPGLSTQVAESDTSDPEEPKLRTSDSSNSDIASTSTLEKILLMMMQNQSNQKVDNGLKLPSLEIEVFDGNIRHYRTFKTMFNRAIAKTKWSDIERFTFLQSKLIGEAADAIEDFEVTSDSYSLAWEERFNNRRKLLESIVESIIDVNLKVQYNNAQSASQVTKAFQSTLVNIKQLKYTAEELVVELFLPKMDKKTRGRFEDFIGHTKVTPPAKEVSDFLQREKDIWHKFASSTSTSKSTVKPQTKAHVTTGTKSTKEAKCFICGKSHVVVECDQFLSSDDREQLLRKHRVCIFCASHSYSRLNPCRQRANLKCEKCGGSHITLLHPLDQRGQQAESSPVMLTQDPQEHFSILPTAIATLLDSSGSGCPVRCLVDLCAEKSYVSENVVQQLKLKKRRTNINISGINGLSGKVTSFVNLTLKFDDPKLESITIEALVVPKISGKLPSQKFPEKIKLMDEYQLADPSFDKQSFVGALLGGDVAARLFKQNVPIHITQEGLLLQPTHLGWIVSGSTTSTNKYISTFVVMNENMEKMTKDQELTQRILDFYQLPEYEATKTCEDDFCEQLFQKNHYRMPDGRYVVPMPWKQDGPELGHSYRKSLRMFKGQEGKWMKNQDHYDMSNKFMTEYENLGHMSRIENEHKSSDSKDVHYIPYLSIIKKGALTTKLRNVFNASMPTSNGISLNDTMFEGPKLQTSIWDILMTGRSFKFIYSADISMMFRQILVLPEDRDKLRIIWRSSNDMPPEEYRLNTVTYGTDAAPFLAIRTIHQCAMDNASTETANIIHKAFYVDDLLYGADTIDEARIQIHSIKGALSAGKFLLTKWMANNDNILTHIPLEDRIISFIDEGKSEIKLLGVTYDFASDSFRLNLKGPETLTFTKRGISSASASFYDPMGFILPFIMQLRIFLQRVWQQNVEWDEKLTDTFQNEFQRCIQGVTKLNAIKIPRLIPSSDDNEVELIGFADASNHAQAAVIYSRCKTSKGYEVNFLTAKGNVSKWKTPQVIESKQCTIPKLELEALVTLAELFKSVKQCFTHKTLKFTAYTDSQVALAWVRSTKSLNKRFIERRVTKIRAIINPENLHYVKSEENPADPASRGLTADQLSTCALWFLGPSWLQQDELPTTPYCQKTICHVTTKSDACENDMFARYSSWIKVLKVVAYCLSWRLRKPGYIKAEDITRARKSVLLYYQNVYLGNIIRLLQQGKPIPKTHWLYRLSPFVDKNDNMLRVGGRLGNAHEIPESQRHPIVIPKSHGLNLLVRFTHLNNGHALHSLMLRILVEEYWIPGVKNVIKTCILKCPKCNRWNAYSPQPEMSQLPKERVTPSNTFEKVGVDLCGPFIIKASPLRFDRTIKVWVVNFVCLSTKAVHLEIVTSLSTDNFLAAFARFCCRRGTSVEVWSDNGTNFIGANRLLRETWQQIVMDSEKRTVTQEVAWKFIPRHSPTFGGLWEACVKSLKYFIKRMADVKSLTYEEFETLLCKIEALLNSRPLCANPLTPDEEPALTPFHFINQRGYKPTPLDVTTTKVPLTKKWLMIHRIQQDFWQRFNTEYLRELQTKVKWQKQQKNLSIDEVVVIKDPSSSPGEWKMGKITKLYPDPNGVVRKVDVFRSEKGNSLHAVNQLVPLLRDADDEKEDVKEENKSLSPNDDIANDEPSPNERSAKKVSLIHLCLLVMLVFPSIANTLSTEEFPAGIHRRQIDQVYMKSFDLKFSVKTNLNLTHDLNVIHNTINDFKKECLSIAGKSKLVSNQCSSLNSSLSILAHQTTSEMLEIYHSRSKRWLGITSKGIWKAAPVIATSLGMVYQETQIHSLQNQLADTRLKLQKTAHVLLNVTELEYAAIEGKLNDVIDKQQEILLQETIISYAQDIELLFGRLKSNHEKITTIQPYSELLAFIKPLLEKMPTLCLPDIGTEIFGVYPPVKAIQDDITIITFTIPIVKLTLLNVWILLSVPSPTGQTTLFSNGNKFQRIVVNNETNTFADVTEWVNIHSKIVDYADLIEMNDCLKSVFTFQKIESSCKTEVIASVGEEMVSIYSDLLLIFTKNAIDTLIECDNLKRSISMPAVIVNTSECSVMGVGRNQQVTISQDFSLEIDEVTPISIAEIEPLTHDPIAVKLRNSLKNDNMWLTINPSAGYLFFGIIILVMFIIFTAILMKYIYAKQQTTRWYPEFVGPESRQARQTPDRCTTTAA